MKKLAILILAVGGVGVPVTPAAAAPAETSVTINYFFIPFMGEEAEGFDGSVLSSRKSCAEARKVVVFRKRSSGDERIGNVLSNSAIRNGPGEWQAGWQLDVADTADGPDTRPGRYYATAKATDTCEQGESELFRLSFEPKRR